MKKYLLAIVAILLTSPIRSHASAPQNMISIKDYENELDAAVQLFQNGNYEKALPALEIFAKRGEKKAQYIVGSMYLTSKGTEQDLLKSYAWLTVANEQKTQAWRKPIEILDEQLPHDYLQMVNNEAQKYIEQYGAKAQQLKCRNRKTLGSRQSTHECSKTEIEAGYYFVNDTQILVQQ